MNNQRKIFIMGSLNMDLSITCDKFPVIGQTIIGKDFISNPGGKGANQAIAISKIGGNAIMLGAVGNDSFGEKLITNLNNNNVNCKYICKKDDSTGIAIIILENGDNRIILDSGANYQYEYEDFASILIKEARPNDILVTQLETRVDVVEKCLKLAKSMGLVTILNPAPACKINDDIYNYLDFIIPNESEAQLLSNINFTDDYSLICKFFLEKGVKNVIITLGEKGSFYSNEKDSQLIESIKTNVVDTTAAGDTFIGAFTAMYCKVGIIDALKFATYASSLTITKHGAQQAIPTYEEVLSYIKEKNN